jgi:adenylate kinase
MGIVEDELKQLKDIVSSLESRIKKLEAPGLGLSSSTEELRMILIGPPGAGMRAHCRTATGRNDES